MLGNPSASEQLRAIPVGIGKSVYEPLVVPQLIDEIFGQILDTVVAISDPFEQAFFVTFDTGEVLLQLAKDLVPENDREYFLKITKEEIAALHEGNFARHRLRPAEFNDWQKRRK